TGATPGRSSRRPGARARAPGTRLRRIDTQARARESAAERNVDVAVAVPLDFERGPAVRDGLLADVVPGAVIDLAIRPLVHAHNHDQPAPRLQLSARHALALEHQLHALTGV